MRIVLDYRLGCVLETFNGCTNLPTSNLPHTGVLVSNARCDIRTNTCFEYSKHINTSWRATSVEDSQAKPLAFIDRNIVHFEHGLHSCFYVATNKIRDRGCSAYCKAAKSAGLGNSTIPDVTIGILGSKFTEIMTIDNR